MTKPTKPARWITIGSALAAVALVASFAPNAQASTSGGAALRTGPARVVGHSSAFSRMAGAKTTNWAGYVDTGQTFSVIRGGWSVPHVTCTSTDSVVSFWVGMDGWHSKNVEQAGTLAYCHNGKVTYYTWWEMYPTNNVQLVGSTVKPGDNVTSSVAVAGHTFTLRVIDHTSPTNSFTKKTSCASCRHTSAEWIAERPGRESGLYPLAKFGHLTFYGSRVGVGAARGSISKYSYDSITMINHTGATMARVSGLQSSGNRFIATWLRPT